MATQDDHRSVSAAPPQSIVPSMADVTIDTRCPAPQSNMNSLNFDRVVNAYSIMHVKRRIVNHHNEEHRRRTKNTDTTTTDGNRRKSEKIENWIQSYRDFKSKSQQGGDHHGGTLLHTPNGRVYVMWTLTILVGLICGGVACLLVFCTEHLVEFRTHHLNWQLQLISGRVSMEDFQASHNGSGWSIFKQPPGMTWAQTYGLKAVFIQYISFNACIASISSLLCILFAPNAVGSGIPEVKAYLNGVSVQSFADLSVFLIKIVATIFSVSSGLIVGPEGPLVHIGAIVGQGITKTTRWEMMMRKFQMQRPRTARMFGCGRADHGTFFDEVKEDELINELLQVGRLSDLAEGDDEDGSVDEESRLLSLRRYGSAEESFNIAASQQSKMAAIDKNLDDGVNFTFFTEVMTLVSRFRNDCDRRDLISIGVATGFASAFGAPVGGLLYSFEEASSFFTIPLMWRTLVATAIGTFVIAIYHGDLSHFSVLSLGNGLQSDNDHSVNSFAELPFYVLIGAAGGLLGAFFNGCYLYLNTTRKGFYGRTTMNKNLFRLIGVLLVSIMTSCVTFGLSVLLPTSWACANLKEGSVEDAPVAGFNQRFNCPDGQFNEIASILLGSRDEALNDILTDPSKFQPRTLLLCGLVFLFLMVITFGIFIPSGLFMPTLLTGSSLFGWAGLLIQRHILPSVVPAHMAMVGATAMLAGIQRTTVSLCVIMMEATGQTQVLIPLIISVVVARYVGDLFNEGFYHVSKRLANCCNLSTHSHACVVVDKYAHEGVSILGA
jgi:H+/Cl- antiporter ClcA